MKYFAVGLINQMFNNETILPTIKFIKCTLQALMKSTLENGDTILTAILKNRGGQYCKTS